MCLVLWYPVEKLFMKSIGFDDAWIGIAVAMFSAVILLVEVPSGILADRWSRRGVLVLAAIALVVSTTIAGFSDSIAPYLVSAGIWAIFFALVSGAGDSIIYDSMLEENVSSDKFDFYLGRMRMVMSVAAVAGSLAGGLVAAWLGLRFSYWLTIPLVLPAFVALWLLREPTLHRTGISGSMRLHLKDTARSVLRNKNVIYIVMISSLTYALVYSLTEFNQLWSIALAAPVLLYGPINAIHLATGGVAGYIAGRVRLDRRRTMAGMLLAIVVISLSLVLSRSLYLTVVAIAALCVCLYAINIVYNRYLHEELPSSVRASASSTVSTIGRLIIIPLSIGIGYLSSKIDIFQASWLIVFLSTVLCLIVYRDLWRRARPD